MQQHIFYIATKRFIKENYNIEAAALTFYTLFALIPLAGLALVFIGQFAIIPEQEMRIQEFFLTHFVPPFTEEIKHDISDFLAASHKLSEVSSIIFLLTAIFLIKNIETCFNQIWHVHLYKTTFLQRIMHYTMVLVVSPIFLGISIALSTILLSYGWVKAIGWLPFLLTWFGIAVLYYWLPQAKVTLKRALLASGIVALLFEVMKYAITLYISYFHIYEIVYGALSVLIIFMLWIYLSWAAVLWGAVFASELRA